MAVIDDRPPQVIGFKEDADERYWCGVDAPRSEFPFVVVPVWRGEVPSHAVCEKCGIPLEDLE